MIVTHNHCQIGWCKSKKNEQKICDRLCHLMNMCALFLISHLTTNMRFCFFLNHVHSFVNHGHLIGYERKQSNAFTKTKCCKRIEKNMKYISHWVSLYEINERRWKYVRLASLGYRVCGRCKWIHVKYWVLRTNCYRSSSLSFVSATLACCHVANERFFFSSRSPFQWYVFLRSVGANGSSGFDFIVRFAPQIRKKKQNTIDIFFCSPLFWQHVLFLFFWCTYASTIRF